jgi:hypothetical protein
MVRKVTAPVIGIFVVAVVALVLVGMISGADANFSKGRSTTASVVTQEVVGALALVALGGAIVGCIGVVRGRGVRLLLIALPVGLLLVVIWLAAYAGERAS